MRNYVGFDMGDPERTFSTSSMWIVRLVVGALCLFGWGCWRLYRMVFFPPVHLTRHAIVSVDSTGCRAEAWAEGKKGDYIVSLTDYGRGGYRSVHGYAIVHPNATTNELPRTVHTDRGDGAVVRYHLTVDGQETDRMDTGQ